MVEESTESGAEEFHVEGFVQNVPRAESANPPEQHKFGGYAELDIDGPVSAPLSSLGAKFHLPNPDVEDLWPQAYFAVVSVLEEDSGGSLGEWEAMMGLTAAAALSPEVAEAATKYLEDYVESNLGESLSNLANFSIQLADFILSIISSTVAGYIGAVVAVLAVIIVAVITGLPDEFYGVDLHTFSLASNRRADVLAALDGYDENGFFDVATAPFVFRGPGDWFSAAPTDGMVEVAYRWRLKNMQAFEELEE